jgi:haloalkane dehalogenase
METIILPRRWADFPSGRDQRFRLLRSPEGERLVIDENVLVERSVPAEIMRKLTDEEMEGYRGPYRERDRRWPILAFVRQLPIEGEPADVVKIVEENAEWLAASHSLPKLFINADPGATITGNHREFCRSLPDQREVTVKGLHHLQDDSPNEIGVALRDFVLGLGT